MKKYEKLKLEYKFFDIKCRNIANDVPPADRECKINADKKDAMM